MPVRTCTPADLPQVEAMMARMHEETMYRALALNQAKLAAFLRFVIAHPDHAAFVHERAPGAIDGVYLGNVDAPFFSDERVAYDLIFYVVPERRGSPAAFRLWRAFVGWAAAQGAILAMPAVSTGVEPERTGRFYRRMGLATVGEVFSASVATLISSNLPHRKSN